MSALGRAARGVGLGALTAAGLAVSVLAVALFIAVGAGGSTYRTTCAIDGQKTTTWGFEGDIPYTWSPHDGRCQAHTLTRYVLGKVGVMSDVAK